MVITLVTASINGIYCPDGVGDMGLQHTLYKSHPSPQPGTFNLCNYTHQIKASLKA